MTYFERFLELIRKNFDIKQDMRNIYVADCKISMASCKLEQEQAKVKQMETAVVVKKESGSPWWAAKKKAEKGKC